MAEKPTTTRKRAPAFAKWRAPFLEALGNSANVRAACQRVGIGRPTAYLWRNKDPEFRAQWETAIEDACDILEAEAWKRARGTSDLLLIFLLKAHRPDKYRERIDIKFSIERERERVREDAAAQGLDADLAVAEFERILKDGARA